MDILLISVKYELELLSRNLKLLNDQIHCLRNDFEMHYAKVWSELNDDSESVSEEIEEEFTDSKEDELIAISFDIPKIYYSSFLITCYSFIEQRLFKICDSSGVKVCVGIKEFDSKGKGIFKIKTFLKKAIGYQFQNNDWNELCKFNKLRNYLVHNGNEIGINDGDLHSDKMPKSKICGMDLKMDINKELYDYLKINILIQSFEYCEKIIPTNKYCEHILELTERLLIPCILKLKQQ